MNKIMNDRRGQILDLITLPIILAVLVLIAGIVGIVAFVASATLRITLIGVAMIVIDIMFFGKSLGSPRTSTKGERYFMFLVLIIGVAFILLSGSIAQSIFSQSSVQTTNGDTYWTFYGSVTQNGENYVFNYLPTAATATDGSGTIVTPQKALTLTFSPLIPTCTYTLAPWSYNYGPYGIFKMTGYTLNNPTVTIPFTVTDGYGTTKTFDGSLAGQTNYFYGGNGEATVQSQGNLGGNVNCPTVGNVIMLTNSNQYAFFYQSSVETFLNSGIINQLETYLGIINNVQQDTQFTSGFIAVPSYNGNSLIGVVKGNLGYPTFTITADQKYFQSTTYTPPLLSSPIVSSISIPTSLNGGSAYNMNVLINNGNSNSGNVLVTVTSSSNIGISPGSETVSLPGSGSTQASFSVSSSQISTSQNFYITATACESSQFSTSQSCNSKTVNGQISSSNQGQNNQGSGSGQSNQSSDQTLCEQKAASEPLLGWTWTTSTSTSCGANPLCWIGITKPTTTTNGSCQASFMVYWIILGSVLIIVVGTIIYFKAGKRKRKRR